MQVHRAVVVVQFARIVVEIELLVCGVPVATDGFHNDAVGGGFKQFLDPCQHGSQHGWMAFWGGTQELGLGRSCEMFALLLVCRFLNDRQRCCHVNTRRFPELLSFHTQQFKQFLAFGLVQEIMNGNKFAWCHRKACCRHRKACCGGGGGGGVVFSIVVVVMDRVWVKVNDRGCVKKRIQVCVCKGASRITCGRFEKDTQREGTWIFKCGGSA